ncbi:hypothetical protein FF38_06308 [Lucilia cuprina]|uniref:Uncharacterized protein n=1 Tax=Lucilia cuprina TaxID=7375 RepID=A0A0L0BXU0_LUCCU|nr:hypothetical protein FF38_06308 [Lucilia cuprina]
MAYLVNTNLLSETLPGTCFHDERPSSCCTVISGTNTSSLPGLFNPRTFLGFSCLRFLRDQRSDDYLNPEVKGRTQKTICNKGFYHVRSALAQATSGVGTISSTDNSSPYPPTGTRPMGKLTTPHGTDNSTRPLPGTRWALPNERPSSWCIVIPGTNTSSLLGLQTGDAQPGTGGGISLCLNVLRSSDYLLELLYSPFVDDCSRVVWYPYEVSLNSLRVFSYCFLSADIAPNCLLAVEPQTHFVPPCSNGFQFLFVPVILSGISVLKFPTYSISDMLSGASDDSV